MILNFNYNMENQINLHDINWNKSIITILVIALLFLVSFSMVQCESNKTATANINALTSEILDYKLKNNDLVKSQEVAILDKKTLEKNIIEKDEQLKEISKKFSKVTAIQTLNAKTTIPKTSIAFDTPVTKAEIDTITNELKFKRNGAYFDKWFEFGYNVTQDSLTIEPFSTWTEIKRVDGFKRTWFLGKNIYHTDIMFTNPYINTDEVHTYQVSVPVKWYETRVFNIGIGLIGGFLLAK